MKTTPERSRLMSRVRQKGTPGETIVSHELWHLGGRFRRNVSALPGSPDVANKSRRLAIFVHGCFWHQHAQCGRGTIPKRNRGYWKEKLIENVRRDRRKVAALRQRGFRVMTVWECELKRREALRRRLRRFWFGEGS